ncbi:aspartate racemase [Roseobacter sp. SK209-2-6]|uniref:aspartate/glutamate racemase family protein n=1 Tax=Roseobacter sp. SK209-2-6 TaxID=388739 RepID=UPI0000F3D612|nr:amino acid racemase [Roseobacter sp. SK209-2-6]EBA15769.1 aspartate racemase [Roseobacter sp. SK209-2-6]
MAKRKIGILGGMGPEATVLMMQRIIAGTDASDDCDHVPLIVDNNTQVPSRIDALVHEAGEDPGVVLAEMARGLSAAGAEALIMPCNTAHHYAPQIIEASDVPFLNMVELTARKIASEVASGALVGILASPAVRKTGLFERTLAEVGLQAVYLSEDATLLRIIQDVKAHGPSAASRASLTFAAEELVEMGAAALLVACTEFSLQSREIEAAVPITDSLDVVVQAALQFAQS